jgi:polyferredoxin
MGIQKSDRRQQRLFRTLRLAVLVFLLLLSTALGILHQYSAIRPVGVDALDPFGGIESAITVAISGQLVEKIAWTSFVLLAATILVALLYRRVFCGHICAFGALQELFARLGKKIFKKRFVMPRAIDRPARFLKYIGLVAIVVLTAATAELSIRPYDPWAAYHHIFSAELISGFLIGLVLLIVSVAGSMFYDRFFCKYLCPMGAFLGLINRIGYFRVKRNDETCTHCMLCDRACPMNIKIESVPQVQSSECINCNLCVVACPVKDTLVIAGPKKHRTSPFVVLGATAAIFLVVIGASNAIGSVEWTVKPLAETMVETNVLDPANIKGTDTFQEVSRLSGIPKAEFINEFKLTEEAYMAPIKDSAHKPGSTFDTDAVREFVAARMKK